MKLKTEFLKKVLKWGSIDTAKYRYKAQRALPNQDCILIERIKINYLDTTLALSEWEPVAMYNGRTDKFTPIN